MVEKFDITCLESSLRARFNYGLKKARIYPELLDGVTESARLLHRIKTLVKRGAEFYILPRHQPHSSYYQPHPVEEKYMELYLACERLSMEIFSYNSDIYAKLTENEEYVIGAYLGEWKPFFDIKPTTVIMSITEYNSLKRDTDAYQKMLKRRGVKLEPLPNPPEGFEPSMRIALTDMRSDVPFPSEDYRIYHYGKDFVCFEKHEHPPKWVLEEEKNRKMFEDLISKGRVLSDDYGNTIVELEADNVELEEPVRKVAERIFVARDTWNDLVKDTGISISTPLSVLHACKYLEEFNIYTQPARARVGRWTVVLTLKSVYANGYKYHLLIKPKHYSKLPPIPLARVVREKNRLVVFWPQRVLLGESHGTPPCQKEGEER